jgi:plastocyanin
MKTLTVFFLLLFSASFLSCSSSKSTSGSVPINTVVMSDMKFVPETINIPVGTSVTWHNIDSKSHTATDSDGSWDTGDMGIGASHSVTFGKAGTYHYHCRYHTVLGIGMTGTVIVQ